MKSVGKYLEAQSVAFHIVLNLGLLVLLALADFWTNPEFAFSFLYLIPISLAAWFLGRTAGIIAAVLITAAWPFIHFASGGTFPHPFASIWNGVIRFTMFISVAMLLAALRKAYLHQRELARTDHLTNLANSRSFHEITQREILRANRYDHPFTVAFADVDNFKSVNDRYGHAVGDELLTVVGEVMRTNLRDSDTVARLGGDEFGILLPETGKDAAQAVVKKVRDALTEEMRENGWSVTFSIGVATCVEAPKSVAEVVKFSDDLVYAAKNSGKNTIRHKVVAAN
jgi:diguanylate cyclase (GGDEF) domain